MASFNRVVLVGNLTRDVELRWTKTGTAVTDISLAVNEKVKRNDKWEDEVHFFDVTLWARNAEVAGEYLAKGSSVLVEGRLKHERWEQDGQKKSKIGIVGEKMQFLSSKPSGGTGGGGSSAPHSNAGQSTQQPATQQPATQQPATQTAAPTQSAPPEDEVPF